jgi:hypothetical protein
MEFEPFGVTIIWRIFPASVPILKFCAFHPNALVLGRREAASKDAPVRAGPRAAFWSILRDARLRLAPQDEGVAFATAVDVHW